jgi:hypothetical protein
MMRALKGLSLFGGLAVVLTLLFVIGCSNNAPLQPGDTNPIELGRFDQKLMSGTEGSGEVFDSALIDKDEGGTIEIERGDYAHEFVVEPDAIPQNTTITIRSVNEKVLGKNMIVFEFGPDGLEFSESAKLIFEMDELDGDASTAKLYYYDPVKKKWVYQGSTSVVGGFAEFEIDHFSKYAISD